MVKCGKCGTELEQLMFFMHECEEPPVDICPIHYITMPCCKYDD